MGGVLGWLQSLLGRAHNLDQVHDGGDGAHDRHEQPKGDQADV